MTHSEDAVEGLAAVGKAVAEGAAAHGNSLDALSDDKWVPTEADLRAGRELVAQAMTEPSSAARSEAFAMNLRPAGRGRFAHICEKCSHPSSRHTGGPIFTCLCGCEITQSDPGFWLSERDFALWSRRHPVPVERSPRA